MVWKRLLVTMLTAGLTHASVMAQRSRPQDVELQKAVRTEKIDGDVRSARQQYEVLATKYAVSAPDVASQALLLLAQSYELGGDTRARPTFERVVREFPAQRQAVAVASRALGLKKSVTQERIWTGAAGDRSILSVSPDGQWVAHSGPDGFVLRRPSSDKDGASFPKADAPAFSSDSKRIAFNNWDKREFQIANLNGTERRTVRINPPDVRYYNPGAWAPDGQRILVEIVHQDWTKEIAWMSVKSGDLTVLANVGWRRPQARPERLSLSPDGRSIVYSGLTVAPTSFTNGGAPTVERSLFLLSADGGSPTELVSGDVNIGPLWTPDGRHVVFVSNRGGMFGLWSVAVADGGKSRVLELAATGRIVPIGITATGTLFFGRDQDGQELLMATLRQDGRVDGPSPLSTRQGGVNSAPSWSPDGKYIAYQRRLTDRAGATYALVIHTMADHSERVFDARDLGFFQPTWFADSGRVLTQDRESRYWMADVASGAFTAYEPLASRIPPFVLGFFLSPDGKTGYGLRPMQSASSRVIETASATIINGGSFGIMAVDLASGTRRAMPSKDDVVLRGAAVSPDGTAMAVGVRKPDSQDVTLRRIDLAEGASTDLLANVVTDILVWSADSRSIYVLQRRGDNSHLVKIPAGGGSPQDTGLVVPYGKQKRASLNGQTLVFDQESALHEVWVAKNLYAR